MSELERLAGAVLCVGFPGDAPDARILDELAELRPGGLALFARNATTPQATRALVAAVREASGDPYVAVDQEGGRVARLRDGATDLPSMMALGAAGDLELAERAGEILADDLARFDCDLDFAPDADLATDSRGTVIGTRSFGDDPERAGEFAAAVVRGLQRGGAGATLKHFPGHGATSLDSHIALPTVDAPLELLRRRELATFARALRADPVAVMSAHVVVRALDSERPATLSPRILRDVLRGELGFEGVCFSDCLEMLAISAAPGGAVAGALAALEAGCDVVLLSHTFTDVRRVRDAIVAAVEAGTLAYARLEDAAARVAVMRERLRSLRAAREIAPGPAGENSRSVALEIARRAVTLVRGNVTLERGVPLTIVSFEAATNEGIVGVRREYASLNLALRTRGVRSEVLRVPLEPEREAVEHLIDVLSMQGQRRVVVVARRAQHSVAQARAIDAIGARFAGAIAIAAAEPFDVAQFGAYANVACTYGDSETAFEGLADVLTGRVAPTGRMPVDLERAMSLAENA